MKFSNTAIIRAFWTYRQCFSEYPSIVDAARILKISIIRAAALLAWARLTGKKA